MKNILRVSLSIALAFSAFSYALVANPSEAYAVESDIVATLGDDVPEGSTKSLTDENQADSNQDDAPGTPEDYFELPDENADLDAAPAAGGNTSAAFSAQVFAAETGIVVTSSDGSLHEQPATLAEAIALANSSSAPAVTITLDEGTYEATANNQFRITRAGITIEGAPGADPAAVIIDGGTFAGSGQGAILIAADNVTIKNLTVVSSAGGNVSAIKVSMVGSVDSLPAVYNTTISNVILKSANGHALNIHGAEGVAVNGLTVLSAGKLGISLAMATGVTIENTTINAVGWGADIGTEYAPNNAAYATPSHITLGEGNTFANGIIYSSRPASETADTIAAPGLAVQYDPASGGWYILTGADTDALFVDENIGTEYDSFAASAIIAPDGAVLTQLDNIIDPIAMPAEAEGKSLTIDGGSFSISGGFEVGVAMTSLKLNNMTFSGAGFVSTEPIADLAITNSSFSGGSSGSAICISNQAGATSISSNAVENWNTSDPDLSAISIVLADDSSEPLTFTGNKLKASDSSSTADAPLLRVLGSGFTGTADLSSNYWMGQDPLAAGTSSGAPLADLSGIGSSNSDLSSSLGSYYLDEDMSDLVPTLVNDNATSQKPGNTNNKKPGTTNTENAGNSGVVNNNGFGNTQLVTPINLQDSATANDAAGATENATAGTSANAAANASALSSEELPEDSFEKVVTDIRAEAAEAGDLIKVFFTVTIVLIAALVALFINIRHRLIVKK